MRSIDFHNEYGESISVALGADGKVLVSHSDIADAGVFGEFVDVGVPMVPGGAALIVQGESFILNAREAERIRQAVAELRAE